MFVVLEGRNTYERYCITQRSDFIVSHRAVVIRRMKYSWLFPILSTW